MGEEQALYFVRSAVDRGTAIGSKLFTSFPGNLASGGPGASGLPAVQAVYVLFDGADGRPLAVLDGTEITWWKTAADSALGAKLLAPAEPAHPDGDRRRRDGAMAGARAPMRAALASAACWCGTARPRGPETWRIACAESGIAAEATADLEAAVRQAQVITSATRSHTPLIKGAWLAAGRPPRPGRRLHARDARGRRRGGPPLPHLRRPPRVRLRRRRHPATHRERRHPQGGRARRPLRPDRRRSAGADRAPATSRCSRTRGAATST